MLLKSYSLAELEGDDNVSINIPDEQKTNKADN